MRAGARENAHMPNMCPVILSIMLISCAPDTVARRATVTNDQNFTNNLYGVSTGLPIFDLERLPYRIERTHTVMEGDRYDSAIIFTNDGIEVNAIFDMDGGLYSAETFSSKAVGPRNTRIGSILSDVERAWLDGRLIHGEAEGRFVRYITGTNVIFTFDPNDLDQIYFDDVSLYIEKPDLKVKSIQIYNQVVPLP